jgi:hypothetical protein
MNMDEFSISTLQLAGLALPYVTFVAHNSFQRWWLILFRALTAIGIGWAFWLAFVFAADALNRAAATTEAEIEALNNGDGAKFVFALVFGWVVPAVTVGLTWVVRCWLWPRLRTIGSNKPLKERRGKSHAL